MGQKDRAIAQHPAGVGPLQEDENLSLYWYEVTHAFVRSRDLLPVEVLLSFVRFLIVVSVRMK